MEGKHNTDREQRIRERAYQLWEEGGRPGGEASNHWHRANEGIASEDAERELAGQRFPDDEGKKDAPPTTTDSAPKHGPRQIERLAS
jgi:hypothetical protein